MPATIAVENLQYDSRMHEKSREIMNRWYANLKRAAANNEPSAALMISGNCVEILWAFDIHPIFPEVNALQLAIRKKSLPFILKAEEIGYSGDNCAYVKADIGYMLSGGVGPQGEIPKPSFLLCNFVGCNVYIKWFEHVAHFLGVPLVMLDIPFKRVPGEVSREDIAYVVAQLKDLIQRCEDLTGQKLDMDRLKEVLRYSVRAEEGWTRIKELAKNRPTPYDWYFDAVNMMGPINVLRGTREAAEFFEFALAEAQERVRNRQGPLPEERFRVVFEGPPPYPYYRNFRNLFARWGAVGVASSYSNVGGLWEHGFRHDPDHPLQSIAEQMILQNLTNRSLLDRYSILQKYVTDWGADALVIHSVKSCRLFSAGQGDMRDYFTQKLGIPTLMLESDLEDPRYYAEAQLKNRIDAFFEALEHRKLTHG